MLKIKDYILIGLITALAILLIVVALLYYFQSKDVKELSQTITQQETELTGLRESRKLKDSSDELTDKTDATMEQKRQDILTDHTKIEAHVESSVQEIEKEYSIKSQQAPEVSEAQKQALSEARSRQISKVRMQGLWQTYCAAKPDNPKCAPLAPQLK